MVGYEKICNGAGGQKFDFINVDFLENVGSQISIHFFLSESLVPHPSLTHKALVHQMKMSPSWALRVGLIGLRVRTNHSYIHGQ